MQHPGAKMPFVHFASRKLCRDAPEELETLHKDVSRMMSTVTRAGRLQNLELEREREKVQDQLKLAQAAANKARSQADTLRSEIEARDRLLSLLYTHMGTTQIPPVVPAQP